MRQEPDECFPCRPRVAIEKQSGCVRQNRSQMKPITLKLTGEQNSECDEEL